MSLILSIETSTKNCSVAIHKDGSLIGSLDVYVDKSHSTYLAEMIKQVVYFSNYTMNDLSAVAIAKGPGSYTGLRIGTSTAKGLCYGLNIPLVSVNSLTAMAHFVNGFNQAKMHLCPMFDARRMEVYYELLDSQLNIITPTKAHIVDSDSFSNELEKHPVLFFGDGMDKTKSTLEKHNHANFLDHIHPKASSLGDLAFRKYKNGEFENTNLFEPFYLKDFIATIPKKLV